jgi:spermidine/putrescine ABC transporter ATP-binding subunit
VSSIELAGIAKHYGSIAAIDRVSLRLEQGELVTILGPSGSGKTTLLTLIAGLAEPTSGSIHLGGRDVTHLPAASRNIGLVFQSYALFPHMTVFANVAFPLAVRKVDKADIRTRVAKALELVRLSGFEKRRPAQLSGGQQQRVALARALVFQPEILLLDEPLAALDRKLREEVQVELRQLQHALQITTVLVTHDQEEALSLSDRIVVLADGRVQQIGAPEEVYFQPRNRFVAEFLGTANFFTGTARRNGSAWQLELPGGAAVPCPPPSASLPAAPLSLMVRPERIALRGAGHGGLAATVKDVIFLGKSLRYHLQTSAGTDIIATSSAEPQARHAPGAAVALHWQPEDAFFVGESRNPSE